MNREYNIGLDIGTTSVGWAVVETNTQKIIRKGKGSNRKALWGVRLFDEALTAEERRNFRSVRRRYDRRRQRIKLLQEEFSNEINKVDSNFFQKLQESKYTNDDQINKKINLSKDEKNEIRKYQQKYKTIYHLRNKLIINAEKEDIRLVYLSLHHIIKYRGNFLYQNSNFNIDDLNLQEKLFQLFESLINNAPELEIPEEYRDIIDINKLEKSLLNPSKNDVKVLIKEELINIPNKKFITEFGKLMVGSKGNLTNLLILEEADKKLEISFKGTDYDDKYDEYQKALGDKIEILDILKQIYDCIFLIKLFKGNENSSISALMVEKYNQHAKDLKFLKKLFRSDRVLYNKIFRNDKELCLYEKYITNKIDYDEFKKELDKFLINLFDNVKISINQELKDKYEVEIKEKILNGDFLPRITTTDNGKYPYQLNKSELIKIIENQGKYYPFLLNKLDDGTYKIVKLLEFKIPYYIGPLVSNKRSPNAWMIRKEKDVRITPYNFDKVIDKESTAEEFIRRMISHCTYFLSEYALANNSILYSRFKVMNELKQIRINGKKIPNEIQHKIMQEFFMHTTGNLTDKKFVKYINTLSDYVMYDGNIKVTGYSGDNKFANTMQSYIDFFGDNGILTNTKYTEDDAEQIIEWITIFEDKDILENKLRISYPNLNEKQIQRILEKNYSGWGSLSKKLLTKKYYKDKETEIYKSILDLMEETEKNFMQIINDDEYKFQNMIKNFNNIKNDKKLNYSVVSELATSPSNKRAIYQSLKVVDEIIGYMGYEPKNIMIEMAKSDEKKGRRDTKKDYLKKLYEECKNQIEDYKRLQHELDTHEINSQKLFLYFIQEGKCLYSGTPLNIEDIDNQSLYEIDHIIPRTLIKDNSIDNKALVLRECNQIKKASYVLPQQYKTKQIAWWNMLKENKLISAKKYHNLIREKYSDDDIQGFINRQLVETRQITKHVANILNNYYKKTKVIFLKAELSHAYREKYELFKFRDINDYHHAHDAYLTAVLGEYKEKYMKRKINFDMIKEMNTQIAQLTNTKREKLKYGYVINSLDENINAFIEKTPENSPDKKTSEVLFDAHELNKKIEDTLYRNDIIISRKTEIRSGQFFKQKIYDKKNGLIQIKKNMPVEIYGGYSNSETKKLVLIEYNTNKKKIIGIPMVVATKNAEKEIDEFIKSQINLKKNSTYKILKDSIPFENEFILNNQKIYIKGYSISNKNCEVSNAYQLKITREDMEKWKYALQFILNDKKEYIESAKEKATEIYEYLINLNTYPLFKNEIEKIKVKLLFSELNIEKQQKVIKEIFKLYHCNSTNANLSDFGLGNRIGRLNGINITNGVMISKSTTGLKGKEYEF